MLINNELKMIFFHNPKCGGSYVKNILYKYYNFNNTASTIHHQYSIFFETPPNFNEDTDCNTIRKFGKIRYFITHQDVNMNDLNSFFKFSFVRNPYTRIFSAYNYLKRKLNKSGNKIRNTSENSDYFTSFYEFIKNRVNINNISNFHAFIPQYEHFLDFSNNIKMQYIGKMENLDEDLIDILQINNINLIHYDDSREYNVTTQEYAKNILDEYNEEIFSFVNKHFEKDFEIFKYKKYDTFEEFKMNFKIENYNNIKQKNKSNPIITLISAINKKHKNTIKNILFDEKLIEYIKESSILKIQNIDAIENEMMQLNNESIELEEEINNQTNILIANYFKDDIHICEKCAFKSYNLFAHNSHEYFCNF